MEVVRDLQTNQRLVLALAELPFDRGARRQLQAARRMPDEQSAEGLEIEVAERLLVVDADAELRIEPVLVLRPEKEGALGG